MWVNDELLVSRLGMGWINGLYVDPTEFDQAARQVGINAANRWLNYCGHTFIVLDYRAGSEDSGTIDWLIEQPGV